MRIPVLRALMAVSTGLVSCLARTAIEMDYKLSSYLSGQNANTVTPQSRLPHFARARLLRGVTQSSICTTGKRRETISTSFAIAGYTAMFHIADAGGERASRTAAVIYYRHKLGIRDQWDKGDRAQELYVVHTQAMLTIQSVLPFIIRAHRKVPLTLLASVANKKTETTVVDRVQRHTTPHPEPKCSSS